MKIKKYILPIFLLLEVLYVWHWLYKAQFYQYDENYGIILHCFFISFLTLLALIGFTIYKQQLVRQHALAIGLWFLIASPVSLFLVMINYKAVFGAGLAH